MKEKKYNKELNEKSDEIVEKICTLNPDISSLKEIDPKVQKLIQINLANQLPDLLLRLKDSEIQEFNDNKEYMDHLDFIP